MCIPFYIWKCQINIKIIFKLGVRKLHRCKCFAMPGQLSIFFSKMYEYNCIISAVSHISATDDAASKLYNFNLKIC